MSLEQHTGSLQSPVTLSTLRSGLGELFPPSLLAKPSSSERKQIAFLMESFTSSGLVPEPRPSSSLMMIESVHATVIKHAESLTSGAWVVRDE